MKENFDDSTKKDRGTGNIWFNDLKRKREKGPRLNDHRYESCDFSTQSVHAGQYDDPLTKALGTPIYQSSIFQLGENEYDSIHEGRARDEMIYSRYGNPSQWAVQEKISALENAESSVVFSSGMSAISSAIFSVMEKSSHMITSRDLYGGTYNLLYEDLQRFGMSVSFVSPTDLSEIEAAITDDTKLLYFESLTNPLLKVVDIKGLVALAKKYGLRVIIDNTFLTPYNLRTLDFGVDLVINSGTKYLGGHSDLVAGSVSGSRKLMDAVWVQMLKNGGSLDPHACYLLERSLKTFALRMRTHNSNAKELSKYLENHPKVKTVYYPGSERHPQHELSKELLNGKCSGMIAFEIEGGNEAAHHVLDNLKLAKQATSLGGVESLISLPYNTSQASLTRNQRLSIGINDGLIRLSVGIEDIQDLINDFDTVLNTLK